MNSRFIITGFGPFLEHQENPSWQVAQTLAQNLKAEAHLLDVRFDVARRFAEERLEGANNQDRKNPFFFIHIGLAASRNTISFEAQARNMRGLSPDISEINEVKTARKLEENHVDSRKTNLSLEEILASYNALADADLPAGEISVDCGNYVCNALYYHSLGATEGRKDAQTLFIHVPYLSSQDAARIGNVLAEVFLNSPF